VWRATFLIPIHSAPDLLGNHLKCFDFAQL
jgi:hypothetical protein